ASVSSFGDIGIYSFGRYKNLISFYGGMLVTPHEEIQNKVRSELDTFQYMTKVEILKRVAGCLVKDIATSQFIFQHFVYRIFRFSHLNNIEFINQYVAAEPDLNRKYKVPDSYFRRMTPMQARLVSSRIENVENDTAVRMKYASIYHEELADLKELILPPLRTDGSHIYTTFPVQYRKRDSLVRWLTKHRRDIGVQHLKNCAELKAFRDYFRKCPRASAIAEEVILLPTYPRYTEQEVRRNVKVIRTFFRRHS
ncbi:DegT/DnrJ/EryC1/StrS family aminotransferase, partial [Thermodesulfobacteriota bacterium]